MPKTVKAPSDVELNAVLGSARALWDRIIEALGRKYAPLGIIWQPSKSQFGRICLLQQRKRTLVYLTPEEDGLTVAIVLGERAYQLAMASRIPAAIKKMFAEARPYAEGRGIRFLVKSARNASVVEKLVEIKTTPK